VIYTDGIHIVSDTDEGELRRYCDSIGIKRCWYHKGSLHPHYDVPKRMRDKPLPGAVIATSREIVEILNKRGLGLRGKK
jgi:hypothetical protein